MLSKAQAATIQRLAIAEPEALGSYVGVVDGMSGAIDARYLSHSSDSPRS